MSKTTPASDDRVPPRRRLGLTGGSEDPLATALSGDPSSIELDALTAVLAIFSGNPAHPAEIWARASGLPARDRAQLRARGRTRTPVRREAP
ncbi:hypothetical protein ACIRYZ_32135 [Kitasatospora sp. NPDC101155]|uniref:hypothetical protein n=1 Tax=Kitasatospora sp. NPDC101155 TaxID=3364097 RepID=UPI0038001876